MGGTSRRALTLPPSLHHSSWQVTTLLHGADGAASTSAAATASPEEVGQLEVRVKEQGAAVKALKGSGADKQRIEQEVAALLQLKQRLAVRGGGVEGPYQ